MVKIINAKCPNCGAILELPEELDRAFCMHCGGKVIIAKDEVHHHYGGKTAILEANPFYSTRYGGYLQRNHK